ncbi:hypothetical protein Afil01_22920 [Actinorhabdospora filicis]|uniref:Fe2OG dioxygenase domain-containing protein n=1 Tax=Actinorhabdospora filicis TaxID=1785913 RepID=A0A9W6SI08_9ACTN|nr:2OG-Fe(II) oxygenase [Actinorhabdospora filicis]GLZ77485.1 hypothetical protein Afil01_22920 [Actinorhabdospora filicis]
MESATLFRTPFPHGTVRGVFPEDVARELAMWIGDERTWRDCDREDPPRRSFYWTSTAAPPAIAGLLTPALMRSLREQAEEIFGKSFERDFPVSANRYPVGHGIKIHNDYFPDPAAHRYFFTHRLIVYLSPDTDADSGGLLGIFERDDPGTRIRTIVPAFNAGSLMAMGPGSFHAVSAVKTGVRYSIGFSFTNITGRY